MTRHPSTLAADVWIEAAEDAPLFRERSYRSAIPHHHSASGVAHPESSKSVVRAGTPRPSQSLRPCHPYTSGPRRDSFRGCQHIRNPQRLRCLENLLQGPDHSLFTAPRDPALFVLLLPRPLDRHITRSALSITQHHHELGRTLKRLSIREAVEQITVLGPVGWRCQIEHFLE